MADLNMAERSTADGRGPAERRLRVILADDHELVVEGLRGLLVSEPDLEVVGQATEGGALLALLERMAADVVVMDLQMPAPEGTNTLAEVKRRGYGVRVLVLTAFADGESIQFALENGADGFALKTTPLRQTIEAIRQVGHGNLVFPPAARKWLWGHRPEASPELSTREWDVLALAAQGQTNPQIAEHLSVSENTVKFHLQNIFQKLGVSNRTEAAGFYFRRKGAARE